jgi:hypothetical protein
MDSNKSNNNNIFDNGICIINCLYLYQKNKKKLRKSLESMRMLLHSHNQQHTKLANGHRRHKTTTTTTPPHKSNDTNDVIYLICILKHYYIFTTTIYFF